MCIDLPFVNIAFQLSLIREEERYEADCTKSPKLVSEANAEGWET